LLARLSNVEMSGNAPESGLNSSCEGPEEGRVGRSREELTKKPKTCILSTQNTCA